jgi:Fe-S cluster biogenesis protein NfuA/nitrite reductase/ring-hydroxylating ferredoxin subunit
MSSVRDVGERVEELIAGLTAAGGPAAAAAEELVSLLVGLYGDGLSHITAVLAQAGPDGAALLTKISEDSLVGSLLLLHDLHPLDVDARIQRALDEVRPYLGSHAGGVQYLGVHDGVARLRLEGSCHGCPSSTVTVQLAITGAVQDAAPEVTEVVVEGMTEPPAPALLQIGSRPPDQVTGLAGTAGAASAAGSSGRPEPGGDVSWITLPNIGPPSARPVSASAAGLAVLVCAVRGTLYAYRDACPGCGGSLADGVLDRELLTCPACALVYNVRLAGRGLGDTGLHLDPLPLLTDSQGVRVAVPEVVRA